MAILPQKSVELLSHINQEIGIDISKYGNDEIVGKVTSLLSIQTYAISSLFKPLLFSFGIFLTGFFILNLQILGFFVYGFFGFILFSVVSILWGTTRLLSKLKHDLLSITKFALDTTNYIVQDIGQINTQFRDNIHNPVSLVFEGALAAFVTPHISQNCNRIPFAGKALVSGSDKVLNMVVTNLKKQEDKMNISKKLIENTQGVSEKCEKIEDFLAGFSSNVDSVINKGFRTVQFPFKVAAFGAASATGIFMFFVYIF